MSYDETSLKLFVCFWKRSVNTLFKRPQETFYRLFINAVWVHLCMVGRGLKKTLGIGRGRIFKKDSQDELPCPPHCLCCCKGNFFYLSQNEIL